MKNIIKKARELEILIQEIRKELEENRKKRSLWWLKKGDGKNG